MLHQASDLSSQAVAWLDVLVAVILTYGVPALSLIVAYLLGRVDAPSPGQLRARRFAHLELHHEIGIGESGGGGREPSQLTVRQVRALRDLREHDAHGSSSAAQVARSRYKPMSFGEFKPVPRQFDAFVTVMTTAPKCRRS